MVNSQISPPLVGGDKGEGEQFGIFYESVDEILGGVARAFLPGSMNTAQGWVDYSWAPGA